MLKVSMLIQMTERVTAPVRRIRAAIHGMVVTGERDVKRLDRMMDRLGKTSERIGRGIGRAMRWGALAAVGGVTAFGMSIIKTGMKFEQFQTILENTEGSSAGAKRAMDWVKKFAETTPYELDQVMESFVRLKAYGIDATDGSLRTLGDAASGMGKDLMAAVEMLADAQTGEFERMKEFGVRANAVGKQVKFTYMKDGKEMTVSSAKNAASIKKALLGILDSKFAGQMDKQSRTLAGIWSNLKDKLSNFELDIAGAGFFDYLKGQIQRLLDWVNKLAADGTLQRWAKQISDRMVQIGEKIKTIDWNGVASGIGAIADAIVGIVRFAGWLERTFGIFNIAIVLIVAKIAFGLYGLATALVGVSIAGSPLWAVVAVIAAIAAGAILVWKNWDTITAWFAKTWANLQTTFQQGWTNLWNSMPWWLQKIFQGVAFAVKFSPLGMAAGVASKLLGGGTPAAASGSANTRPDWSKLKLGPPIRSANNGNKQAPALNGKVAVDLRIRTDQGTTAKVERLSSNDKRVPMSVRGSAAAA